MAHRRGRPNYQWIGANGGGIQTPLTAASIDFPIVTAVAGGTPTMDRTIRRTIVHLNLRAQGAGTGATNVGVVLQISRGDSGGNLDNGIDPLSADDDEYELGDLLWLRTWSRVPITSLAAGAAFDVEFEIRTSRRLEKNMGLLIRARAGAINEMGITVNARTLLQYVS